VIVRRGQFATFELLSRTFADPTVQIVWDRRMRERRSADGPSHGEGRRISNRRRVPPTQWGQLNYIVSWEFGS
jgi:hypothetical protein